MKRILKYLKDTGTHGLMYSAGNTEDLNGFSDSFFAGDLDDWKSTSRYFFLLGGASISWRSKKQGTVALSTAEAEYVALSYASHEGKWLRQLISELKFNAFYCYYFP